MKQLVPNQFLFRFAFACRYSSNLPGKSKHLVRLGADYRLPFMGQMDGQPEFAELRIGWNEAGIGLQYEVPYKDETIYGESGRPKSCDGLSLWIDTRDTRTIHRASRYCQRFTFTAHDGSDEGHCSVHRFGIHRALEDTPAVDLSQVQIARFALEDGEVRSDQKVGKTTGYRLEVFLPAAVLYGFDPDVSSRLGFFYRLRDREMGDQLLGCGPELPYWEDPSLWSTLELVNE